VGELRPAQLAWGEVRTCRIGEAGTAPTSTAKFRTDAVPHTVLAGCFRARAAKPPAKDCEVHGPLTLRAAKVRSASRSAAAG
jgi:hypothetical protein